MENRKQRELTIRMVVTPEIDAAIRRAAAAQFLGVSTYCRQTVMRRLAEEGMAPDSDVPRRGVSRPNRGVLLTEVF